MLLGGQVGPVVVVVVVVRGLPGKQAVVGRVAGDDARRGRGRGGGRGRRGQVGVGDVVRASVESQGGLREGGMQGLRRGVGAPQAPEQCVIHGVQTHQAFQGRWARHGEKVPHSARKTENHQHISSTRPRRTARAVKRASCGHPERTAAWQAVQEQQLAPDRLQQLLRCQEATEEWSSRLEAGEVPRNCRTRGASRGDVINRV